MSFWASELTFLGLSSFFCKLGMKMCFWGNPNGDSWIKYLCEQTKHHSLHSSSGCSPSLHVWASPSPQFTAGSLLSLCLGIVGALRTCLEPWYLRDLHKCLLTGLPVGSALLLQGCLSSGYITKCPARGTRKMRIGHAVLEKKHLHHFATVKCNRCRWVKHMH